MPGPPVLLGSCATRVISWVTGVMSSCRPSGGVSLVLQNLVGARWSSSGHPTGMFFCLIARFVLASASTWHFGYSMFGFSVALLPGAGGVSFAFVTVCDVVLRNLPCSSVGGLHCTGLTSVRKIAMGECYILWGQSGLPGLLRRRVVDGAFRSYCHRL